MMQAPNPGLGHGSDRALGGGATERPDGSKRRRRRLWLSAAGAAVVLVLLWFAWSIGGALTAPGTDSLDARLAEWARSNNLGWAVDALEHVQYALTPPRPPRGAPRRHRRARPASRPRGPAPAPAPALAPRRAPGPR